MHKESIPPFYYPTTVVFVDDSKDFLSNFSMQFDPSMAYRLYTSPHDVLAFFKSEDSDEFTNQLFSSGDDVVGCPATTQTLNLDLSKLYREVYEPKRFAEVSTLVVDYAMPDINGLDLCTQLKDLPIKKILLTGEADAHTAVSAFNEGLIDQFILKSDPNVMEKICEVIHDMQLQYFLEKSALMTKMLAFDSPGFLTDPSFCERFHNICKTNRIVEYYLTENTGTFLLLDAQGGAKWLIVNSPEEIEMQVELARDNNAPADVIEKLQSERCVIHFWQPERAHEIDPIEWESYLLPAQKIVGKSVSYFYALVDNPPVSILDPEGITSYKTYLKSVDHKAIISR